MSCIFLHFVVLVFLEALVTQRHTYALLATSNTRPLIIRMSGSRSTFDSMGPEELRNEIDFLRRKLQRRNELLETVQRSYLEDVVIVQRAIDELKKHGHVYEIFCSLKSLPSLNLKPWLQLFSPSECEFAVRSEFSSGGYVEIIHREAHKVEEWMTEAREAKNGQAEALATCEDFKCKVDAMNRALEDERRYREEDKIVLLRQIESLRVSVSKQDPRSHEKLSKEVKKLREQCRTQQQHIQTLEGLSSTVESLKTQTYQQERSHDTSVSQQLKELEDTRLQLTKSLQICEELEQHQAITKEEVKSLVSQKHAFELREKETKDRMDHILTKNISLLQTIEGLNTEVSRKTAELEVSSVARDERILELETKLSITEEECDKGKAIIEQKSRYLEAELMLSKELKSSLESMKSSYANLQATFQSQAFKVERHDALISRLRKELRYESNKCRELMDVAVVQNERVESCDSLISDQKQTLSIGHDDGNDNDTTIAPAAKDSMENTSHPGDKAIMIRFLLSMKSKLIQTRLEASQAQQRINQLQELCSKREIEATEKMDEVQQQLGSKMSILQNNGREKDSQVFMLKSTLAAKIRESSQSEAKLRQNFDAKVTYYEDHIRFKENQLLDEKARIFEVDNEIRVLKARLEEVLIQLHETAGELQVHKAITESRERVLETNQDIATQTNHDFKRFSNKESQTTFYCAGLYSLKQPKAPFRTTTVESLLLNDRQSQPENINRETNEEEPSYQQSTVHRPKNNEMTAGIVSVSQPGKHRKMEVVISLPRLPN